LLRKLLRPRIALSAFCSGVFEHHCFFFLDPPGWGMLAEVIHGAFYVLQQQNCHIHGEPIRESIIPLNAIQYKFYPASCVLSSSSPEIYEGMDKMNKINRYYTSYQRHASEINWCYCNGHRIGRYIDKIYDYARKNIPGATIDYNQMATDEMVDYPSPYYSYYSNTAWFVDSDGYVNNGDYVNFTAYGVVPALQIRL
jgi:hypothetical protein